MKRRYVFATLVLANALVGTACREEGPAERTGKKIDKGVDDAKDAVDDAVDDAKDAVD